MRRAVTRLGCDPAGVTFVVADLLADAGWDEAVAGSTSSCTRPRRSQSSSPTILMMSSGRRVTERFAFSRRRREAGVKRVVLTSSSVAIFYGSGLPAGHIYSESDFTDETRADLTPYIKSKTIAEKAAWQFVKSTPGAPELAVINPCFVQGPALDADLSTSHELYRLMARGVYPAVPRIRFPVVDVRDVAAAHVEAAFRPEAAGQRYLIGEGQLRTF